MRLPINHLLEITMKRPILDNYSKALGFVEAAKAAEASKAKLAQTLLAIRAGLINPNLLPSNPLATVEMIDEALKFSGIDPNQQ